MKVDLLDIPGVGPKTKTKLNKLSIFTPFELINYYPFRYEDKKNIVPINELVVNQKSLISVKFDHGTLKRKFINNKTILTITGQDETGRIEMIWFNQPYIIHQLRKKEDAKLFGSMKVFNGKLYLVNPEIQVDNRTDDRTFTPVYRVAKGVHNNLLKKVMKSFFENYSNQIEDIIPLELRKKYKLLRKRDAVYWMHYPKTENHYFRAKITLAFEELLIMQLGFAAIKANSQSINGFSFKCEDGDIASFSRWLLFELTNDQKNSMREIAEDMASKSAMNRIIQGDVGSGKTVTAFFALYLAWKNKQQTAMMVPTEILARQHYATFNELFSKAGIRTALLIGSLKEKEKKAIKKSIAEGEVDFVIGTHALLQETVSFNNLNLVITDEQHRFGVKQRAVLVGKGTYPDVLVMSATPIPRTLSLILYGDLDISTIRQKPPGRKDITTKLLSYDRYDDLIEWIKQQITKGKQAYFVTPSIFENENDLVSVEFVHNRLTGMFDKFNVEMIHGKQTNSEKEHIFAEFSKGNIDVLVATTVIEVGVNVPNATVMVIEGAERFGLSQLHQLRGRVGRGSEKSYCFLLTESNQSQTLERLTTLTETNDGFQIAQRDLEIRGPGEFLGLRQHGEITLRHVDTFNHTKMIRTVRLEAEKIMREDPNLKNDSYATIKSYVETFLESKKIILN